jgi:hypothetical protein
MGREPVMSVFDEALEWRDRAEQARQVAGDLTDPGAKQAMLQAANGYEHLARAAGAKAQKRDTNEPGVRHELRNLCPRSAEVINIEIRRTTRC